MSGDSVYQPAEDSELLRTAVEAVLTPTDIVLEVGVGSGWVAEALADWAARVVTNDLNPHACRAAADRGLAVFRGHLVDAARDDTFDVVCFNPPYLPADDRTSGDDWMGRAITGGETGRAVIDPFLEDVGRVLTADGVAVLVVSSLTDVDAVRRTAREAGLKAAVQREESYPFETLVALECRL